MTRIKIEDRRTYEFPPPADLFVESVLILAEGKKGSISTVESGAGGFDDIAVALSNIRGAATQVPVGGDRDVCCLCIGSAVPEDAGDVKSALFGREDGTGAPGVFHPKSEEPGFEHLHAAVHFALTFDGVEGDQTVVAVKRTVTVFDGPKPMSERQRAFLDRILSIVREEWRITIT